MTRPTILDRDDVAVVPVVPVVPVEPTEEMKWTYHWRNGTALNYTAMLSASPHSSAWQEVREYVAWLEKKEARASASLTGLLDALEHHTGERHGIMAIRHLVDRIAELEKRLADADVVNDAARDIITRAQQNTPDHFSNWHEAARAWKEGK